MRKERAVAAGLILTGFGIASCVTSTGGGTGGRTATATSSTAASASSAGGGGGSSTASAASTGGAGGASSSSTGGAGGGSASSGSSTSAASSSTGSGSGGGGGNACTGSPITCSGSSVDPCTDVTNCGGCDHDCLGTTCLAGVCQSATLASGQPGVFGLAVDGTNVYWAKDVPNQSPTFMTNCAVMKQPVTGGAAVVLGTVPDGRGYDITVNATDLYLAFRWNNFEQEGEIHRLPLGGGAESGVTAWQTSIGGIALGAGNIYWGQEHQSRLQGVSITGGASPTFNDILMNSGVRHGITVDATSVYTANTYAGVAGGQILKWAVGGGDFMVFVGSQPGPNYITADATNLYWTNLSLVGGMPVDHQGTVVMMPKAGGAVTTLATGLGGPRRIVVDATNVYWTDDVDGTVMKAPIAGGTPTVLATGQTGANAIAVDATSVYWTDSTALTVMKVAK